MNTDVNNLPKVLHYREWINDDDDDDDEMNLSASLPDDKFIFFRLGDDVTHPYKWPPRN